jgi:signal transduction histidine kinase/CheY-like chemotaxis protein
MKNFLVILAILPFFIFAEEKLDAVKIDSFATYIELANYTKENQNDFQKSRDYLLKAINFAKNRKNIDQEMQANYALGSLYFDFDKKDEAVIYLIKCYNYYDKNNANNSLYGKSTYLLGLSFVSKKNTDLANLYFNLASKYYSKNNLLESQGIAEVQKGLLLKNQKKYDEAIDVFNLLTNKQFDFEHSKIEAYFQLGEIYGIQENYELALENSIKAIELFKKKNYSIHRNKILKNIIFFAKKTNNYQKAFEYLTQYNNFQRNENANSTVLFNKLDNENQLDLVDKIEQQKKNQVKSQRFSRLISILSVALVSILSLLCFSLYKNNKIRNSLYKILQEKNKELTKQKERAEFASQARADFLSTVSHELRTPLNAINGITYLLLKENPKESQLEYLKSLEFSGGYLLNFINDILEINRLESSEVSIEKLEINLPELLQNIKVSFNEFTKQNNVTYTHEIDLQGKSIFKGDSIKISQILINLINNAIKFSANGNVWLQVKTIDHIDNQTKLRFIIKDNGIGIEADKIDNIFDSFNQGSTMINRTYGGTGLGLAIVKRLVEVLDSDIHLESTIGKGTQFTFDLWLENGAEKETESKIIVEKNQTSNEIIADENILANKTVLIVEDNKINQMITKKMVDNKGMVSSVIDNAEDAIELLKEKKFDLILMDVHLPGINGTEATKIIREFDTETVIIAVTAISLNENREMLLSFGMNDVVTKPFNPDHFYNVIESYFK